MGLMIMISRIQKSIVNNPTYSDYQISKSIRGANTQMVKEARSKMGEVLAPAKAKPIPIKQNTRVQQFSPRVTVQVRIKQLPLGMGFELSELAVEWGISETTIRGHASVLKCLRYIEMSEGHWVQVVMNPETAAKHA